MADFEVRACGFNPDEIRLSSKNFNMFASLFGIKLITSELLNENQVLIRDSAHTYLYERRTEDDGCWTVVDLNETIDKRTEWWFKKPKSKRMIRTSNG